MGGKLLSQTHTLPSAQAEMFRGWRQSLGDVKSKSTINVILSAPLARQVAVRSSDGDCGFTATNGREKEEMLKRKHKNTKNGNTAYSQNTVIHLHIKPIQFPGALLKFKTESSPREKLDKKKFKPLV